MSQAVYTAPREWTRVHPVSPLLTAWAVIPGLAAAWFYMRGPDWARDGDDIPDIPEDANFSVHPALVVAGLVLIVGIVLGTSYLSWYFTQYRIGDDAVYQRKGVVSRQQKQARLNRLQAVDVVQPLLGRIFGFAKLRIEVAGGEGSATEIAFLRTGDADALRNEIVLLAAGHQAPVAQDSSVVAEAASAAGVSSVPAPSLRDVARGIPEGEAATPAAPDREMYHVPTGRLIHSLVRSWGFVIIASLLVIIIVATVIFGAQLDELIALAVGGGFVTTLTAVAGALGVAWAQVNAAYGFRASISEDGIRLKHGLVETRRQTVPPGRVQAVHLKQSMLWRSKDWWKVTINVAGYQDATGEVSTLLPVGSRQDALTALWLVLPDLGDPDPASTVSLAMSGKRDIGGFIAAPPRAMVYDLIQWRFRGVKATDKALLIRRGWMVREVFVVPHERTQSLSLKQGPLQRLLNLASLDVHSTRGPVSPVADHLATPDAVELLADQSRRAREGRRKQTPEQWMAAVGLRDD